MGASPKEASNMEGMFEGMSPHTVNKIQKLPKQKRDLFFMQFNHRRKSEGTAMILTAIGCIGVGGLGRFYVGDTGLGIIYILTAGVFFIGTAYDLVRIKDLVKKANEKIAQTLLAELELFRDE